MLPIHAVLEPLKTVLSQGNTAVLAAPPGAGKTTVVPWLCWISPGWGRGAFWCWSPDAWPRAPPPTEWPGP